MIPFAFWNQLFSVESYAGFSVNIISYVSLLMKNQIFGPVLKLAREPCFEMFWPLSYYSDVRTKHKQICEWLLTQTTCSIRFTFTSSGNGRAHDPLEHRLTPKSRLRRKHVAKHDTFMMRVLSIFDTMSHR